MMRASKCMHEPVFLFFGRNEQHTKIAACHSITQSAGAIAHVVIYRVALVGL